MFARKSLWRSFTWVLFVIYLVGTIVPLPNESIDRYWSFNLGWDKVAHALFLWVFGLAVGLGWRSHDLRLRSCRTARHLIFATLAVGVFSEWIQYFLPWRQGLNVDDIFADLIGAILAWLTLPAVARLAGFPRTLRPLTKAEESTPASPPVDRGSFASTRCTVAGFPTTDRVRKKPSPPPKTSTATPDSLELSRPPRTRP